MHRLEDQNHLGLEDTVVGGRLKRSPKPVGLRLKEEVVDFHQDFNKHKIILILKQLFIYQTLKF